MKKSVSIFGLGYVGAVTAACLAHKGHRVIGVDVAEAKAEALNNGRTPIVEARVEEMIASCNRTGDLCATTDGARAVMETGISFISVGTPSQRNGKLDLKGVEHVCHQIGQAIAQKSSFHTVVVRSTVLPGTAENLVIPTLERSSRKQCGVDFAVCNNPEFLREGTAVADFMEPTFTVLGARSPQFLKPLLELYEWAPGRVFETTLATAEMIKYVCNAFHALKAGFANEVGALCGELGVDAGAVTEMFTSDTRLNISRAYLTPGFAFGGSCLPKDVRALTYCAKEMDLNLPLMEAILPSNSEHVNRAVDTILSARKRQIGLLGLSFKEGTDDLRESPMVELAKRLIGEGCSLKIWDKNVALGRLIGSNRSFIEERIPHIGQLLTDDLDEVISEQDVIVIGSKALDRKALVAKLRPEQILIDLVNVDRMTLNLPAESFALPKAA
ncbi:MAG: GDP-mannose dehydrogenase [Acidobacteria bacterium]|nr:MAG: GDP-mannose dehydrogenase [Acidobacteriota bacterium]